MLVGLYVGIILILSYKYHINYKEDITLNLSYEYEQAVNKYNNGDNEYLIQKDKEFSNQYPSNIYTNLINLYSV